LLGFSPEAARTRLRLIDNEAVLQLPVDLKGRLKLLLIDPLIDVADVKAGVC